MKRCPNCNQIFSDENNFCLSDGTTLIPIISYSAENRISEEIPTQILLRSQTIPINPQNDNSKWLYLIIGAMGVGLAALAIFIFLPRNTSEKTETNSQPTKIEMPAKTPEISQSTVEKPTNQNFTVSPQINPDISPSGKWSGDWSSKSGTFTEEATFNENEGKVVGQIVWTIRRTSIPKKMDKIGTTAIEFVQGTFNPTTRMLDIRGYRKDDPNNIVILDKYKLSLSEDNQTLIGKSINGKFILRR